MSMEVQPTATLAVVTQLQDTNSKEWHRMLHQLLSTTIVSWNNVIIGYSSAYTSPSEFSMIRDLNLTTLQHSWICSLLPVGAIIGSVSGGPLIELMGRKTTLFIINIIFVAAWALNMVAWSHWNLHIARLLCGFSVGIASFTVPVYLAETVQHKIRGRLGLFPAAFGNLGILLCYGLGNLLDWRQLAAVGMLLSIPYPVLAWLIPESPHWYVSHNNRNKAFAALQWFRGRNNIEEEYLKLESSKMNAPQKLISKIHVKALLIVLGLMFFQQFSGINAVIFYTAEIFETSGSSLDAYVCATILGAVNFITTFIATGLIDRLGRKVLLYISAVIVAQSLTIMAGYHYLMKEADLEVSSFLGWIPLFNFVLYVVGFSLGLGPVPWLLMGEVLPQACRGPAASVSAAFSWICTFAITKTFPLVVHAVGAQYVFGFFAVMMICALAFIRVFVPETKQKTLHEIERILSGGVGHVENPVLL